MSFNTTKYTNNNTPQFSDWSMDQLSAAFEYMNAGGDRMKGIEYYAESGESDMEIDLEYADELMEGVELSAEYDSLMEIDDVSDDMDIDWSSNDMEIDWYYDPADMMDL